MFKNLLLITLCLIQVGVFAQGKINYKWHKGEAILKTDLKITGEFKFVYSDDDLPVFQVKDDEIEGVKEVKITNFRKLTLMGAERGVSSRPDTTIFVWVNQYDDLLRVVREGEIIVYDNSKVIDEEYKSLDNYMLIVERPQKGIKTIKKVADLNVVMGDTPYFLNSARATGKSQSRDFRVIAYMIDLFNDKNPMKNLGWPKVNIQAKNGKKYEGYGYLQPMDVRNEYNTDEFAYLHFYDTNGFKLLRNDELEQIWIDNKEYKQGYFGLTNKNFLGIDWSYEGENFIVVPQIVNRNSYFFNNRDKGPGDYIIFKEISGSYLRPTDESALRKIYFNQLNASN